MLSVGLTGGIATGKSLAAGFFAQKGAFLIDADSVARQAVMPGTPGLARIAGQFGQTVLDSSGALDRKKLGSLVFADSDKRMKLEEILHPIILSNVFSRIEDLRNQGHVGIVVADIPLLFECGIQKQFDKTVLVYADSSVQLQRLITRDRLAEVQAIQRLSAQLPIAEKRQLADFIIDNNGILTELEARVTAVWSTLCELLQKK
jgi:dephospho-CoA kinase